MIKQLSFIFLTLFFTSNVSAGIYMDLNPGVLTKKEADRVLGPPIKEIIKGVRYDYSPEDHEASRLSLTFNRNTRVIETINIYSIEKYSKGQLREWFELNEPSKTAVDTNGNFIEYYGPKGISLHFEGPGADSPVAFFSHFDTALLKASLVEKTLVLKKAEEDSAYAWVKIAAERGFFIYRELRKLPTLGRLKTIAENAGRKEMGEKYHHRLSELNENIDQALETYADAFRQLEKIDRAAIDAGFEKYRRFLSERNATEQLTVLKAVKKHMFVYFGEKKTDNGK